MRLCVSISEGPRPGLRPWEAMFEPRPKDESSFLCKKKEKEHSGWGNGRAHLWWEEGRGPEHSLGMRASLLQNELERQQGHGTHERVGHVEGFHPELMSNGKPGESREGTDEISALCKDHLCCSMEGGLEKGRRTL